MFVLNFKLDFKKIFFACILVAAIVATLVEFGGKNLSIDVINKDSNYDFTLTDENFIDTLENIHNYVSENIGKTIKLSGFVFKKADFKDTYFVCGRNTISDNQDMVAGFMCNFNDASKLIDNEWVEVTGVLIEGNYNGNIPIIKVGKIEKITAPANTFVKNSIDNTTPKSSENN